MATSQLCSIRIHYIIAFFIAVSIGVISARAADGDHDTSCQQCLEQHYTQARDSIIRAWTVVDTLRSMTIEPKDRAPFVHRMFSDSVAVMHALSGLATSCRFCAAYYQAHSEDILYLKEILGYMMEAYEVVFFPLVHGEEKLLHGIMATITASMETINHALAQ